MTNDMIPTAEVARLAGVTVKTVHRWVESGQLTPVVIAPGIRGPRLFDPRDVALFLAKRPA
jgi:DNA-binding transcriptional MerR regulator